MCANVQKLTQVALVVALAIILYIHILIREHAQKTDVMLIQAQAEILAENIPLIAKFNKKQSVILINYIVKKTNV